MHYMVTHILKLVHTYHHDGREILTCQVTSTRGQDLLLEVGHGLSRPGGDNPAEESTQDQHCPSDGLEDSRKQAGVKWPVTTELIKTPRKGSCEP